MPERRFQAEPTSLAADPAWLLVDYLSLQCPLFPESGVQ
jgi:hypothetical protein